ncbi:helix-turn-helix domain-containing protein [Olivibacter domesticus]|uniref:AraC-type DNA-binding protein n=1 Tax=Olivibacter domesticus TaxID=407022 RepID=A0A1H7ZDI1_OLID1|nr:AraC family transcriptional regulator [Olivibacter domesticus]SEM56335.1 AraC-type DNA-binding protein [Olivibacter domesticus]
MRVTNIHSCHLGPEISPEQFISDHFFLCLLRGSMVAYDGQKTYTVQPGNYCIARKNHLLRYTKYKDNDRFEKVIITFDEPFLKRFLERHPTDSLTLTNDDSFLFVKEETFIANFIQSLKPYYNSDEAIDEAFADIKREELLLILLRADPSLAAVFFNFGAPAKIDLEEFMNRNFRFNISLERFAFLTGRSLSSFKRDFYKIFNDTPRNWLRKKRLDEAHFQLSKKHLKSSEVYLEVGFEDLSHFSFAFKKQFGYNPSELMSSE